MTMDGRADAGPPIAAPGVAFLSESSWNLTGAAQAASAPLSQQWSKLSYAMTMPDTARGSLRNGQDHAHHRHSAGQDGGDSGHQSHPQTSRRFRRPDLGAGPLLAFLERRAERGGLSVRLRGRDPGEDHRRSARLLHRQSPAVPRMDKNDARRGRPRRVGTSARSPTASSTFSSRSGTRAAVFWRTGSCTSARASGTRGSAPSAGSSCPTIMTSWPPRASRTPSPC